MAQRGLPQTWTGLIAKNDQPVTTLLEPHLDRQGSANPPLD